MDRSYMYPLRAAVAAIALGLAICATAAERDEHAQTQTELSPLLDQANATYGEGSPKVIPALCELGDFFSETGKAPEAQMTFNVDRGSRPDIAA